MQDPIHGPSEAVILCPNCDARCPISEAVDRVPKGQTVIFRMECRACGKEFESSNVGMDVGQMEDRG